MFYFLLWLEYVCFFGEQGYVENADNAGAVITFVCFCSHDFWDLLRLCSYTVTSRASEQP